jgi:adenylate cyclase
VDVRRKSFDVLRYLVEHPGRVVSKEELIRAVWPDVTVGDESLTQCISEVRRALDDEGQRIVRTVPRRGYLIGVPISANNTTEVQLPTDANPTSESWSPAVPLPDRASIAVLALANLEHDPQLEYFADGLVEDIITDLARFSELFVIARNSSFQYKDKLIDVREVGRALGVRYVLEGSIRRSGERVRVTLQLIDAQTGAHCWAERYDRQIDEVFQLQDQIANTVAGILAAHMSKAESERTVRKPPATWQAYDYYRRAADAYRPMNIASIYKARTLISKCIAIDPNFALAYVLQSMTQGSTWAIPLDDDYLKPGSLDAAHRSAEKAVQLDPSLPQARYQLGLCLSFRAQREAAVAECERAVVLNSNYTDWRFIQVLVLAGQYASCRCGRGAFANRPFHAAGGARLAGARALYAAKLPRSGCCAPRICHAVAEPPPARVVARSLRSNGKTRRGSGSTSRHFADTSGLDARFQKARLLSRRAYRSST